MRTPSKPTRSLLISAIFVSVTTLGCEDSSNQEMTTTAATDDLGLDTAPDGSVSADRGVVDDPVGDASMRDDASESFDSATDQTMCPAGQASIEGQCELVMCEPNAPVCRAGELYTCADDGQSLDRPRQDACFGRTCIEGDCRPIKHNVAVLFDTSVSMNRCVQDSRNSYEECCNGRCPGEWPICETESDPLSRLGYSKRAFQQFFAEGDTQETARLALLTFPQTVIPFNNGCSSSVYDYSNFISGDDDRHESEADWFLSNASEVVRVPFPTTWAEDNTEELLSWVDFSENDTDDPELRATGFTPLGRSIFYAGEYFRHAVIANGKPCTVDVDCGSQDYVCIDGACRDPNKDCRLNILLVFTDGKESTHPLIDEYFNPVVQARRLKFGLKCESDGDCLAGASCDGGYCRRDVTQLDPCSVDNECPDEAYCQDGRCTVPGFLWPTDQGRCADAGNPCLVTDNVFPPECAGFLEACEAVEPYVEDRTQGANQLRDYEGNPISITTHVINVNDEDAESRLIASHGGGLHFRIDLNQEETLVRILSRLVDYKRGGSRCALEGQ